MLARTNDGDSFDADFERGIELREQGSLQESLQTLAAVTDARTRQFGRSAFQTQCAISQQGRTLRAMGRFKEATDLHWEILGIRFSRYGYPHPYTEKSAEILAETLEMQGNKSDATAIRNWISSTDNHSSFVFKELERRGLCDGLDNRDYAFDIQSRLAKLDPKLRSILQPKQKKDYGMLSG